MKGIIAEIGNNHYGDIVCAKEMIAAAHEAGAHYIKLQAIEPNFVSRYGSMPYSFYEKCALTDDEYNHLIDYGESLGATVFYSIFGTVRIESQWRKLSAKQFSEFTTEHLRIFNHDKTVISVPWNTSVSEIHDKKASINNANVLVAGEYLKNKIPINTINYVKSAIKKPVGYSDHSIGYFNCVNAIGFNISLIEKHFYLGKRITHDGNVFRDSYHSINPEELKLVVEFYKEKIK